MQIFIIQKYGMTALAWATSEGREQVVDVLLKAGANPDIQDKVELQLL
jgi:ankyrin repeat protein